MDFLLNEEQRAVQKLAYDFAQNEIAPYAREHDEQGKINWDALKKMGPLGLMGGPIPEEYGGAGFDYVSFGLVCEEIERAETAFRVIQSVHVGLNSMTLLQWGTEEQKQKYLMPQARGEKLATFGLTEPGAGSDAGNVATTARKDGDYYILNGSKIWISLADVADHFLVFASLDRSKKHHGMAAFILERGMEGLTTGTIHGKLGVRAGNTGEIVMQDVRVPKANMVGEEGEGFAIAMSALDWGRFTVATGRGGPGAGVPRRFGQVRQRAQRLWQSHRQVPAGAANDRQDGGGHRDFAPPVLPRGLDEELRHEDHPRNLPCQVARLQRGLRERERRHRSARRLRLFVGVPG